MLNISNLIIDTVSLMLSILTDTEKAVVETITKGLLPGPSLKFLEDVGHKMSRATYFRHKKKIEDTKQERIMHGPQSQNQN
jgi:hypothetical protein